MRGGSVSSVNMSDAVAGSQRVAQTGQHWWVQHREDEPLPGCNIPVCIFPWMPESFKYPGGCPESFILLSQGSPCMPAVPAEFGDPAS